MTLKKLAIIAGGGDLPLTLADACRHSGRAFSIFAIRGAAEPERLAGETVQWVGLGTVGDTIKRMGQDGCQAMVLAGRVTRPDFTQLKLDWQGTKLLPKVLSAARKGDDALLGTIVREFEKSGFEVLAVDQVLTDLVIGAGPIGAMAPNDAARADIAKGVLVARTLGGLDIGQGAVVADGTVLAMEGVDGTDAMLDRVARMAPHFRGTSNQPKGVLVKMVKPAQDRRADLPAIGAQTVRRARAAGLAGIAVEAGGALIMDRDGVSDLADHLGLFIVGIPAPTTPGQNDG